MNRILLAAAALLSCFFASVTSLIASTALSTNGGVEITISSTEDLLALSEAFESEDGKSSKPQIIYQEGAIYVITQDIDMAGVEWLPLGRTLGRFSSSFAATINGNGHTIKNLGINQPETRLIGFIGVLSESGRVENLTIEGKVTGHATVGGVVGINSGGVVENCTNRATIQGYESDIGGVVGINNGAVINCKNYGEIYCDYQAAHVIGGVVASSGGTRSYVKGCINYADITSNAEATKLGGVVGSAFGQGFNIEPATISECVNYGALTIERTESEVERRALFGGSGHLGGIAADAVQVRVTDCHNHGKIENKRVSVDVRHATRGGSQYAAGIAARASEVYMLNCSNGAPVIGSTVAPAASSTGSSTIEGFNNSGDISSYLGENAIGEIIVTYRTTSTIIDSKNSGTLRLNVPFVIEKREAAGRVYQIGSAQELLAFNEAVISPNGTSALSSKIKYEPGATYRLTADIDLQGVEWRPIGGTEVMFDAIFDGNNKRISGVKISNETQSELCAFFTFIGGEAIIENLSLSGEITADNKEGVASIVSGSAGIIRNCSSSMILTSNSSIAGLVGSCDYYGSIVDCLFEGEIHYTGVESTIGGIAGNAWQYATISGCENRSNITLAASCFFVGGIVGYTAQNKVINCVNNGNIRSTKKVETQEDHSVGLGGIVGFTDRGSIIGCINNGSIESQNQRETFVGGIIGDSSIGTIACCINNGDIVGDRAAGIVAKTDYGYITNCSNFGTIRSVVSEGGNAGGIIGVLSQAVIANCLNGGEIISIDNVCYAGGITGFSASGNAVNCVNIAPTRDDFKSLGGIAGYSTYKYVANSCSTDSYYFKEDPTSTAYPFGIAGTTSDITPSGNFKNGCFAKSKEELMSDEFLDALNKKAIEVNTSGKNKAGELYVLHRWIRGEDGYPMVDRNTVAEQ